jgi:hypothetical protein
MRLSMTTESPGSIWQADDTLLATVQTAADAHGFFSKSLEIRPGTRAVVFDGHASLGEVPPGVYTLKTFAERLVCWNRKAFTAVIMRGEDIPLTISSGFVLTADGHLVEAVAQLTLRISDPALMFANLLGRKTSFSTRQLQDFIQPLLQDALSGFISARAILQLRAPGQTQLLDANLAAGLRSQLERYGLQLTLVHTLRISHPRYDKLLQLESEVVLLRRENAATAEMLDQLNEAGWLKIREEGREQQLEIARRQLKIDRLSDELKQTQERVRLRRELRDAVLADDFDKLNTAEERIQFLHARGLRQLKREDEHRQLEETIRQAGEDRQRARSLLLQRLQMEQDHELQILRIDLAHQLQQRRRQAEIDLVRQNEDEASRRWRAQLEREAEAAEQKRQEQWRAWRDRRTRFIEYWDAKRTDEISRVSHEAELARILGDTALRTAEQEQRLELLKEELQTQRVNADIARQTRLRDFQTETREREAEIRRRQQKEDALLQIEIERARAQLQGEMEKAQRDDKLSDLERRARILQQIHEQERLEAREKAERESRDKQKQAELFNEEREREFQRQQASEAAKHARELEKGRESDQQERLRIELETARQVRMHELRNLLALGLAGQSSQTLIAAFPEVAHVIAEISIAEINAGRDVSIAKANSEIHAKLAETQSLAAQAIAQAGAMAVRTNQDSAELTQARADRLAAEMREREAHKEHIRSLEEAGRRLEEMTDRQFHSTLGVMERAIEQKPTAQAAPIVVPPVVIPQSQPVVIVPSAQQPQHGNVHVHTVVSPGQCPANDPADSFCTNCGTMRQPAQKFCAACGQPLKV